MTKLDFSYLIQGLAILFETIAEFDLAQRAMVKESFINVLFEVIDEIPDYIPVEASDGSESDADAGDSDGPMEFATIRNSIVNVVTSITMCDSVMGELASNALVVGKFKLWLQSGIDATYVQEEESVRMAGALCIGNLARSGIYALIIRRYL